MEKEITLSDGTKVSLLGDTINIFREGDFEGEDIPIKLWQELKEAVDRLIKENERR